MRRGVLPPSLLAALALIAAAAPLRAQSIDQFVGKPVASVRMNFEGRELQDPELLALVDTRVGAPLKMADVRETMAHLHGLGRFQDVEVHATLTPAASVDLLYDLIPLHSVRRIVFRGQLGVGEGELREFVRDRFGTSPPVGRAADAARGLTELLAQHGFLAAQVTPQPVVEHAPERTILVFNVEAGAQARIGEVRVMGGEPPGQPSIRARARFRPGQPLDRVALDRDRDAYLKDLRSRGYYQARVDYVPRPRGNGGVADLEVTIDTGPHIQVVFRGDPLPARVRTDLVPIEKEASVDEDLLEDTKARIEQYFQAQGYRDAKAPYEWAGDDVRRELVFTVTRGQQYRFADYEITGNTGLELRELRPLLRLQRGDRYVQATVVADLARIAEEYRRRGFSDVKVDLQPVQADAGGAPAPGQPVPLLARIVIVEGPRTSIRSVKFVGSKTFTDAQLMTDVRSTPGQPYYEPRIAFDRDAITLRYLNLGFPEAATSTEIAFSNDKTQVDLLFTIKEGAQVFVDHVLIVGTNRTSVSMIEKEITLRPGQPLGLAAINESQARLAALGLFRRVRISEVRHGGGDNRRDVLVTVDEAPLTTYGFGGGVEGGQQLRRASGSDQSAPAEVVFQVAPRGFFEIGRRNLWGKNRTVNLFTRVTLRPRNATTATDPTAPQGGYGFNEYRVLGTLREPKILGSNADGLLTAFTEQAVRSSFNFARRAVQGEVARRVRPNLSVLGRYSFERARIFDARYLPSEQPNIDRFFPQVRLSSFSGAILRDTRDDAIDPSKGLFTSVENTIAARAVGSELGFVRSFVQTFVYRRLPASRRMIAAGAVRFGVASGFEREVIGSDGVPVIVRDVPASERFFAGGATTVRGFGLDRLGTPDIIDSDGFSKGGDALVVLNTELRVDAGRGLQVAGFVDAGNVFSRPGGIRFTEIRPAAGFGVRYKSPIGPLRFDIGFNLNRRIVGGRLEDRREYHLTLGQAF